MNPSTIRDAVAPLVVGIAAAATDFAVALLTPSPWGRAIACGVVAGLAGFALLRRSS